MDFDWFDAYMEQQEALDCEQWEGQHLGYPEQMKARKTTNCRCCGKTIEIGAIIQYGYECGWRHKECKVKRYKV